MPIDTGVWTIWGAGATDQTGGSLNQIATGVAGQYIGVYTNATYDFTNKTLQVQIAQLPSSATGSQAVLRAEIDSSNAVLISYTSGGLLCQRQLGGTTVDVASQAWPAGTVGLKIVFDNAQSLVWFATANSSGVWTARYSEALPIATTALRIHLFTGCYATVGSPGMTSWDSIGLPLAIYKSLSGAALGQATLTAATGRLRSLGGTAGGVASVGATLSKRVVRNITGSSTGQATASGQIRKRVPVTGAAIGQAVVSAALSKIVVSYKDITGSATGRGSIGTAFTWGGGELYGTAVWGAAGVTVIEAYTPPFGPKDLVSVAVGTSITGAMLTRRRALVVASAGTATTVLTLTRRRALGASATGTSTVTATLARRRALQATAGGVASVSATVSRRRALSAASAGTSTTQGAIDIAGSLFKPLFGASAGKATTTSQTTRRRGLVALSAGTSSVSVLLGRRRALTSSALGQATVTTALTRRRALLVSSQGQATTSLIVTRRRALSASSLGRATTGGVISRGLPLTAVIWVSNHFEMSPTGALVLWDGSKFSASTGDQVIWQEQKFKEYVA